jgi:6-phosphogluconolactonase (cycloisomerase 2 family)
MAHGISRSAVLRFVWLSTFAGAWACGGAPPTMNSPNAGTSPAFLGVSYNCLTEGAPSSASIHGVDAASGLPAAGIGQNISGNYSPPVFSAANGATRYVHFAAYEGANQVALQTHSVDARGAMRLLGSTLLPAGTGAFPIVLDRSGRFLVTGRIPLAEGGPFGAAVYRVDGGGAPQLVSSASVPADIFMFTLAIAPSGRFVYGHGFGSCCPSLVAFSLNPDTGALAAVPGSPFAQTGSFAMALHPTGRFLYTIEGFASDSIALSNVDATSGVPSRVRGFPSPFLFEMTIDPSGRFLYGVGATGAITAYAVDTATGSLSRLPDTPLPSDEAGSALSVDSSGSYLYVRASSQPHVAARARLLAYRLDAQTGALSPLSGFPSNPAGAGCPSKVTTSP